jgi:hypothetical protein
MSYRNIKEINPCTFFGLTKLEKIYLINNQIEKINRETFIGLINLEKTNLI